MPAAIRLRPLHADDRATFIAQARASRALHAPWVQLPTTAAAFDAWWARKSLPGNASYAACVLGDERIAGVFNLSHIVLGNLRSAYLGYWAFAGYEGRGLMREALPLLVKKAFRTHKLHRIEANIQPGNTASIALVRACGFQREGFSPRYLKIAGRWRDHERWAVVAD